VLEVAQDRFWLADYSTNLRRPEPAATDASAQIAETAPVVTPEELFKNE
jgi:hypothetical protein